MKLVVVPFTKRDLEPGYVVAPTSMILFYILGRVTNHAYRLVRRTGFHDRAPIAA
jgi:hypothetical protein